MTLTAVPLLALLSTNDFSSSGSGPGFSLGLWSKVLSLSLHGNGCIHGPHEQKRYGMLVDVVKGRGFTHLASDT